MKARLLLGLVAALAMSPAALSNALTRNIGQVVAITEASGVVLVGRGDEHESHHTLAYLRLPIEGEPEYVRCNGLMTMLMLDNEIQFVDLGDASPNGYSAIIGFSSEGLPYNELLIKQNCALPNMQQAIPNRYLKLFMEAATRRQGVWEDEAAAEAMLRRPEQAAFDSVMGDMKGWMTSMRETQREFFIGDLDEKAYYPFKCAVAVLRTKHRHKLVATPFVAERLGLHKRTECPGTPSSATGVNP